MDTTLRAHQQMNNDMTHINTHTHNRILLRKTKKILPFVTTWIDFECIKWYKSEKDIYPLIVEYKKQMTETNEQIRPNKHTDTNRVVVTRGERVGGGWREGDQLYGDRRKLSLCWWAHCRYTKVEI